jgi:O-antigen/teichoic acid export membrane protein
MALDAAPSPPAAGSLSSAATRNALATVAYRCSNLVVGMMLTPFVLHRIGPELYGIVVAAGSAYEYLSLLRGGIGSALRRFVTVHHHAGRRDEADRFYAAGFWWSAFFRLAILIAGLGLSAPLARFLHAPPASLGDATLGIALIFTAAILSDTSAVLEVPVYATGRVAALSLFWGALQWVRLGLTVLGFHLLMPRLAVFGGAAVGTEIVSLVVLVLFAERARVVRRAIPAPALGDAGIRRELFGYGGLAILFQAAALFYLSTDQLLIGRFFGPGAIAHYAMGTRWFPLVLGFIVAAISSLTPLFTSMDARGEDERSRDAVRRIVAIASVLAVPACLAPCVVGDRFIAAWVGDEYRDSSRYLIAMLAPLVLEAAAAPIWMALQARGRIGLLTAVQVPVAIGNVALSLVLGLLVGLGPLGFALGNTAALIAKNVALLVWLARRPDAGIPGALAVIRPLATSLLGGAPGLVLLWLARPLYGGGLARVMIAGTLGGALALAGAALATLGPSGIGGLWRTARRALGARA